jgi:hypothetical protein
VRYRMGRRVALPAAEQAKFALRAEAAVVEGELDPRTAPAGAPGLDRAAGAI